MGCYHIRYGFRTAAGAARPQVRANCWFATSWSTAVCCRVRSAGCALNFPRTVMSEQRLPPAGNKKRQSEYACPKASSLMRHKKYRQQIMGPAAQIIVGAYMGLFFAFASAPRYFGATMATEMAIGSISFLATYASMLLWIMAWNAWIENLAIRTRKWNSMQD